MKQFAGFALIAATTLAATLAVGAPPALAEGAGGHGARMMQRLDLNRDGAITVGEAAAVRAVRFLRLGVAGDGPIPGAEPLAAAQASAARPTARHGGPRTPETPGGDGGSGGRLQPASCFPWGR